MWSGEVLGTLEGWGVCSPTGSGVWSGEVLGTLEGWGVCSPTGSVSVERRSTWYFGRLGGMLSHWVCECGAEKYLVLWKVGGYALLEYHCGTNPKTAISHLCCTSHVTVPLAPYLAAQLGVLGMRIPEE